MASALDRYGEYRKANRVVILSNLELFSFFKTRIETSPDDINSKLILSDLSSEENIRFFNKMISFISTDMMLFPRYALEWRDFLNAFIDILEEPYQILVSNFILMNKTFQNLHDLRSEHDMQASQKIDDERITDSYDIDIDAILNSKLF